MIFDGRTAEDFKLTGGVWVHNIQLRNSINSLGQPFLLEVVIAAPNKEYLTALVFPNLPVLRGRFKDISNAHPDDVAFLHNQTVVGFFRDIFRKHNAGQHSSSRCVERFILLTEPASIDKNETTDKGYINQSAVLAHRAAIVDRLYTNPPPGDVVIIDQT